MPRDFPGRFSDGRTAAAHDVTVRATPAGLEIRGSDGLLLAFWKLADLRADGQLPGGQGVRVRCAAEPDARLSLPDGEFIRAVAPAITRTARERRGGVALIASAAAAAAVAVGLYFGIPAGSRHLATLVPASVEAQWGESLAAGLERQWGTCRAPAGDAALALLAARIGAALPEDARPRRVTVVRQAAENALALPGGTVMIFQGLLEHADGPDEIAGVLAHEMTHVAERHVAAATIRGLGIGLVVALVTGDASGLLAGGAATLLTGAYSRDDETAADRGAVALLQRAGISPAGMAAFFRRIGRNHALPAWLSTHPDPNARAAAIEAAAKPGATAPALPPEQWKALKGMCG